VPPRGWAFSGDFEKFVPLNARFSSGFQGPGESIWAFFDIFQNFVPLFFAKQGYKVCRIAKIRPNSPAKAKEQTFRDSKGVQIMKISRKTPGSAKDKFPSGRKRQRQAPFRPEVPENHSHRQGCGMATSLEVTAIKYSPRFDSTSEGFMVE
jgi:hypothetical protein